MTDGKKIELETVEHTTVRLYRGQIETDVLSFDYLIGKVFTHAELLGLTDRQMLAYKSTLRQMFWDWYNTHMENETGLADPSKQWRVEAGISSVDENDRSWPTNFTS